MWGKHHAGIIKADGKGYYAHLPATFIYHDLNFGFFDSVENGKKYYNPHYYYDYRKTYDGKTLNKYYCGTAIAMMPFFAVAHVYALNSDYEADGFSKPYNISISLAAIFYALASLFLFIRILQHYSIRNSVIAWVLPFILFGTNWYYYIISEPAVSHVFTIFFVTWFYYLGLKWAKTGSVKWWLIGLILGLIILIRPINILVILLFPAFFKNFKSFKQRLTQSFRQPAKLGFGMLMGLAVVGLQFILYKLQTGHFIIYSYENEGFNFTKPEIINVLFSYKKGLFVYTPMYLFALFGFVFMQKNNPWPAWMLLIFVSVFSYAISCWWNWYYGGSFSSRVYVDILLVFALFLAFFLNGLKSSKSKWMVYLCLILLTLYCQFETLQYRHMIIHWDGMDKQRFWDTFLDFSYFLK